MRIIHYYLFPLLLLCSNKSNEFSQGGGVAGNFGAPDGSLYMVLEKTVLKRVVEGAMGLTRITTVPYGVRRTTECHMGRPLQRI